MTSVGPPPLPAIPPAPGLVPVEAVPAPRRWSLGLSIVAGLQVFYAARLVSSGFQYTPGLGLPLVSDPGVTRGLELTLAALGIIGVAGLLARQRWGWVLTMLLVGLGLLVGLIRYLIGEPDPLGLLLNVVAAFYLNQRSVRAMAGDAVHDPTAVASSAAPRR